MVSNLCFQHQIFTVSSEELTLLCSAHCALFRLRYNGHNTLPAIYQHRIVRVETFSCNNCGSESQDIYLVLDCPALDSLRRWGGCWIIGTPRFWSALLSLEIGQVNSPSPPPPDGDMFKDNNYILITSTTQKRNLPNKATPTAPRGLPWRRLPLLTLIL